jgi:uncharacterized protein YjbI with pentapeptide repeats
MYFMNKGDDSLVVNKLQSLFTTRKGLSRLFTVIVIIVISASIPTLYKYEWSGFGKDSNKSESTEETVKDGKVISTKTTKTEHFQSPKTLWDWLGLGGTIAIPVMIYVFQAGEQRRAEKRANAEKEAAEKRADAEKEAAEERAKVEREIADANLREEALQGYIDRMAEILIDKDRRLELLPDKNNNNDTNIDNPVRDVARVRTTTILRRLEGDKERQGHVLDFLRDAELLQFILSGANLIDANLRGADLIDANLRGANFRGADLSDASLNSAKLSFANLRGANLIGANLIGANLRNANLSGANLSHAGLIGARLIGAGLSDANLSGANLVGANLVGANLVGANLIGANLSDSNLSDANLSDANLIGANLDGANLSGANLIGANLSGANLDDANLDGANLDGANLVKIKNLTATQIKTTINWEKAIYI